MFYLINTFRTPLHIIYSDRTGSWKNVKFQYYFPDCLTKTNTEIRQYIHIFLNFVSARYQWLLVTENINFCHKIGQHIVVRIGNPDFFVVVVCDCHVLFFMGFGFSISVRGQRFLSLYFCHHLCNCKLVSNETCNLVF